jgi:cyclopropane fatty-acyl-phospholipid synthase-like methyltransferase
MNIAQFYDNRCITNKEGWKAAHWISKESQEDNFTLLTQIAPFEQDERILDLGCGQGELYSFLKKRWKLTYEGIDVSPKMIEQAWNNNPQGRFANIDFLSQEFNYHYDWILASGTFNHKAENQYEYLRKCLQKMYKLSNKGGAVILTSRYDPCPKPEEYLFGYDPSLVLQMCLDMTSFVNINHVALIWGFVLYFYNEKWIRS